MLDKLGTRSRVSFKELVQSWLALQVSHRGGTYSVERLLALAEYTTRTSVWNVFLVCAATPVPLIMLAVSQELVPLQDPRDGWDINWGFWIRLATTGGVVGVTMAIQANYMVDGLVVSPSQIALIGLCMAAAAVGMTWVIAACWAFPVPFTITTTSAPYMALLSATFWAVLGGKVFRQMLAHRDQLLKLIAFSSMEVFLALVYPVYQTLFQATAETHYQLVIVLLLPLLKLAMKYLVTLTVMHVEDMMPEAVIITVDFFNALYLASSMQSASSMTTVVAIIAIDLSQTAVGLVALYRRTAGILIRLHDTLEIPEDQRGCVNLLSATTLLCQYPKRFEKQSRAGIRVYSTFPHRLSPESRDLLTRLKQVPVMKHPFRGPEGGGTGPRRFETASPQRRVPRNLSSLLARYFYRGNAVEPILSISPELARVSSVSAVSTREDEALALSSLLLREALAVLFTTECIVLTEFLEFIIPLFYGNYVLAMVHLPSAKYHVEMVGMTTENVGATVRTVFVYALLELVSFVVLVSIVQRNCGMRALSHLAFVLRTQMSLVQGKMLLWVVVTLAFRVVHFGTMLMAMIAAWLIMLYDLSC